ncbi:hypothetical protein [Brevundimonas sp. NIBR11]|uniref:hypothetical protein n=1 Tax=Brevundimonas sp. NIBR11 TaxID=3015999 RepID=UPI0022F11011|nr:hypothetical protein [Brevundimonas sp. NIBR11]WGM31122.1 hypothetical protein KKHFBJBL_01362 [Brevundimonas sp. NIBR11]
MRALTEGERRLARSEFGEALDLDRIRLARTPWPFDRAFVPGRWFRLDWILWPGRGLPADFAVAPVRLQSVFIHELVHVWQAQQGVNLLAGKLRAGDGPSAYGYPKAPCGWDQLNIEQQAMAVEHRFKAGRGLRVPEEAALYGGLCPIGSKSV